VDDGKEKIPLEAAPKKMRESSLGQRHREKAGLSRIGPAAAAQIHRNSVYLVESGRSKPSCRGNRSGPSRKGTACRTLTEDRALVKETARRVWVYLVSTYSWKETWFMIWQHLSVERTPPASTDWPV
jgi:hypothetical protein